MEVGNGEGRRGTNGGGLEEGAGVVLNYQFEACKETTMEAGRKALMDVWMRVLVEAGTEVWCKVWITACEMGRVKAGIEVGAEGAVEA